MILCVDTTKIDTRPTVQKDVNIQELLTSHVKYYQDAESAEKDLYVPLDFSISVRSIYTNLVAQLKEGEEYRYYVNQARVDQFVHKGLDLAMYLSAIGMMTYVDYSVEFDEVMFKHSAFQPIGLYNPDHGFMNPIVYSHVYIADEAVEKFKTFFKPDVSFVHIDTMRERKKGNLSALLDTLITVKGEKK